MKRKLALSLILSASLGLGSSARYITDTEISWQRSDFETYLSKYISSPDSDGLYFTKLYLNDEIEKWLEKVDYDLSNKSKIPSFDSDFEFTLDEDGYVSSMNVIDLRDDNVDKFKDFVSAFTEWQAPVIPGTLPANTKFIINGKWLYVDRSFDIEEEANITKLTVAKSESIKEEFVSALDSMEEAEIRLVSPEYIDFPHIGELINFELVSQGIPQYDGHPAGFSGRIVNVKGKKIDILTSKIDLGNGEVLTKDVLWSIKAKTPDAASNMIASVSTGALIGMSTVGISAGISTNGIATGAGAALGVIAGLLKERERIPSLNLEQGETIKINQKEKGQ